MKDAFTTAVACTQWPLLSVIRAFFDDLRALCSRPILRFLIERATFNTCHIEVKYLYLVFESYDGITVSVSMATVAHRGCLGQSLSFQRYHF